MVLGFVLVALEVFVFVVALLCSWYFLVFVVVVVVVAVVIVVVVVVFIVNRVVVSFILTLTRTPSLNLQAG